MPPLLALIAALPEPFGAVPRRQSAIPSQRVKLWTQQSVHADINGTDNFALRFIVDGGHQAQSAACCGMHASARLRRQRGRGRSRPFFTACSFTCTRQLAAGAEDHHAVTDQVTGL